MDLTVIGKEAKAASRILGRLNVEEKNKGLKAAADALKAEDNIEKILAANKEDIENAKNKFLKKNCDLLVVNDLFEDGAGFKTDTNKVALITKNFVDYLDLMSKEDLAHIILEKLMKVKGE